MNSKEIVNIHDALSAREDHEALNVVDPTPEPLGGAHLDPKGPLADTLTSKATVNHRSRQAVAVRLDSIFP